MALEFDPTGEGRRRFGEIPWGRYVAVGDSLVEGALGDPYPPYPEVGWAQMVADALVAVRTDLRFFNLGKRYLTTRQIRKTQLERSIELKPDLAIVWAGGNDMLLEHFDPRVTERELECMIAPLEDTGATVVTGTMFNIFAAGVMPHELVNMLLGKYEALNDAVRAVGARHNVLFIDFAEMHWTADPDLYSGDLQHANRRGHAAAAEAIVGALADHTTRA